MLDVLGGDLLEGTKMDVLPSKRIFLAKTHFCILAAKL